MFGRKVKRAFGSGGLEGSLDGRAKVGDGGDDDSGLSELAGGPKEIGVGLSLSADCRRTRECLSASGE